MVVKGKKNQYVVLPNQKVQFLSKKTIKNMLTHLNGCEGGGL